MISYIFQGISVFLCGPFLVAAGVIFGLDMSGDSQTTSRHPNLHILLAKISLSIAQGSIFVALSILIACVIRIRQEPPLAELTSISLLCVYQQFVSVGVVFGFRVLYPYDPRRVRSLLVCFLFVFIFFVASATMDRFPTPQGRILNLFRIVCEEDSRQLFSWGYLGSAVSLGKLVMMWCVASMILGLAWFLVKRAISWVARYFQTTRLQITAIVVFLPFTVVWVSYSFVLGLRLYNLRRETRSVAGDSYQDEEWGFGQVTILLLWGSVVNDIILAIAGIQYPISCGCLLTSVRLLLG